MGKIARGMKWTAAEKFSLQIVQFVLGVIIARLISPTEYGILAILMVFINVPQVFIDSGLGNALIYKNTLDGDSLQTSFTFNLGVSAIFVILIFYLAPYIESFYHLPKLSLYIRVTSLVLLTNSLVVVPTAILKIKFNFKLLSLANICSTISSGIIGVVMAYGGYGIWALIVQLMSKSIILSVILILNCKWIPNFSFRKASFLPLYKYGINIFLTSIITKLTDEGLNFIIAKKLAPWSLGIYTRSQQFAAFSQSSLSAIITTVMFPSFSSIKDDKDKFNNIYRQSLEYQSAISIPLWIALAILSKPIVLFLLTNKWADVIPILQVLCVGKLLTLTANITEQVFMAKGRSDLFLKQQIIKMAVKFVAVMCALPFGLLWIAIADAVTTLSNFFITNSFVGKIEERRLGAFVQLKMIVPYLACALVAGGLSFPAIITFSNNLVKIPVFLVLFSSVYYVLVEKVLHKRVLESLLLKLLSK